MAEADTETPKMTATRLISRLVKIFSGLHTSDALRIIVLGCVIGALSGLLAVAFFASLNALQELLLGSIAGAPMPSHGVAALTASTTSPLYIPLMTTATGALIGLCMRYILPDSADLGTDGTDIMIRAFHGPTGRVSSRITAVRGAGAILTIASGASAGQEGPISLIGAGAASWLADRLKLTARERRTLLLAGAAGGLGAIFRAPLGGALTAIEVIYREDFEADSLLAALFSSTTAYSVFTIFYGADHIFHVPDLKLHSISELPFYALLAVVCSVAAWAFVWGFRRAKYQFFAPLRQRIGVVGTTALGGFMAGIVGMLFPQLLGGGLEWVELALHGDLPLLALCLLALGKTVDTALTIGSGMSGGMFAPSLYVGGMTGTAVGTLFQNFFPDIVTKPAAFGIVGMSVFFSCATGASLGPLVMTCELTSSYGLLVPLMLATACGLLLSRNVSLYNNQLPNRLASNAHTHEAAVNLLKGRTVSQLPLAPAPPVLLESTKLGDLRGLVTSSQALCYPVFNAQGVMTGIATLSDLREVLYETCLFDLVVVKEVARSPVFVAPDADGYEALLTMLDTGLDELPVLDLASGTILGMLDRKALLGMYRPRQATPPNTSDTAGLACS
ncbi:MAG: chloride channel protein [Proteobacteria bacterium]|nr:chloride channel protein [Pseudomonadota bacterium]